MATTSDVFESYQLSDGTMIYKVNRVKVSKSQYIQQQALAKEKEKLFKLQGKKQLENQNLEGKKEREELFGITDEERETETFEQKKKRMREKMESFKKGGVVKKKKINSKAIAKKYFKGIF